MGKDNSFEVVHFSRAPREVVFDVLADYAGYKKFTKLMISEVEVPGDPAPNGVGAVRRLGAPGYSVRERILAYDPPNSMSYTIDSGVPIEGYRADVTLEPSVSGGTRITWVGRFDSARYGLAPMLRSGFKLAVGDLAKAVAREAERRSST